MTLPMVKYRMNRCSKFVLTKGSKFLLSTIQVAQDAMELMVTENNTGGTVKAPYNMNSFSTLYGDNRDLLINGTRGGNNTFGVKYKFTPGFYMHAGTYAID